MAPLVFLARKIVRFSSRFVSCYYKRKREKKKKKEEGIIRRGDFAIREIEIVRISSRFVLLIVSKVNSVPLR